MGRSGSQAGGGAVEAALAIDSREALVEELADLYEVMSGLIALSGIGWREVVEAADAKAKRRGRFRSGPQSFRRGTRRSYRRSYRHVWRGRLIRRRAVGDPVDGDRRPAAAAPHRSGGPLAAGRSS